MSIAGQPHTVRHGVPERARGLLLLLHGGVERSLAPVSDLRPAWRQILRLQASMQPQAAELGLSVWAVRNRYAGWNDDDRPSPVDDARAALALVRRASDKVPVILVGHSMGGRTAVRVADDKNVVGVMGLAPWLPPSEPSTTLAGRCVHLAYARWEQHPGCREADLRTFQARARQTAVYVDVQDMGNDIHSMVFMHRWAKYVLESADAILGGPAD
jgi:pimeloyl-ACP methyl ester carboxylesterase